MIETIKNVVNTLFSNPGSSLKKIAKITFYIIAGLGIIATAGFLFLFLYTMPAYFRWHEYGGILLNLVILLAIPVVSMLLAFLTSITTYGIGELIESSQATKVGMDQVNDKLDEIINNRPL